MSRAGSKNNNKMNIPESTRCNRMTESWRLILQSKESLHASDVAHEVNNKRKRNLASKILKKKLKEQP